MFPHFEVNFFLHSLAIVIKVMCEWLQFKKKNRIDSLLKIVLNWWWNIENCMSLNCGSIKENAWRCARMKFKLQNWYTRKRFQLTSILFLSIFTKLYRHVKSVDAWTTHVKSVYIKWETRREKNTRDVNAFRLMASIDSRVNRF